MKGVAGKPIWASPVLERQFLQHILLPLTRPQLYHPELLPIPWCTAIIGRKGIDKGESVEYLLKKHGVPSYQILENTESCQALLEDVDVILTEVGKQWAKMPTRPYAPIHVLVINDADRLCFEPDSEATTRTALSLAKSAEASHCLLVCICDRLPNPGLYSATTLPPYGGQKTLKQFYGQFQVLLYAPCPDGDFRIAYFKWLAQKFVAHLQGAGRQLTFDMDEEQLRLFADHSGHATQLNIEQWMQKIMYGIIQDASQVTLNWDFIASPGTGYISHLTGIPHICDVDVTELEDQYSRTLGKGPLLHSRPPVVREDESAKRPIVTTGFSKAAADLDAAVDMLNQRSKVDEQMDEFAQSSPLRVKRERQEEEEKEQSPKTPVPPERSAGEEVSAPPAPKKKSRGRKPAANGSAKKKISATKESKE